MGAQGDSKEGWPQRSRPPLARFVLVALFFPFYFALQLVFSVAGLGGEIHWGWLSGLVWGPRIAAESLVRARSDARERWVRNRLAHLRAERGWTQEELAVRVGVSRQTINPVERERHDPSLTLAFRLLARGPTIRRCPDLC